MSQHSELLQMLEEMQSGGSVDKQASYNPEATESESLMDELDMAIKQAETNPGPGATDQTVTSEPDESPDTEVPGTGNHAAKAEAEYQQDGTDHGPQVEKSAGSKEDLPPKMREQAEKMKKKNKDDDGEEKEAMSKAAQALESDILESVFGKKFVEKQAAVAGSLSKSRRRFEAMLDGEKVAEEDDYDDDDSDEKSKSESKDDSKDDGSDDEKSEKEASTNRFLNALSL